MNLYGPYNILMGKGIEENDKQLFFPNDEVIVYQDVVSLPKILTDIGLFPSIRNATSNGWNKLILEGWNKFIVGKLKTEVYIVKISEINYTNKSIWTDEIEQKLTNASIEEQDEIINSLKTKAEKQNTCDV